MDDKGHVSILVCTVPGKCVMRPCLVDDKGHVSILVCTVPVKCVMRPCLVVQAGCIQVLCLLTVVYEKGGQGGGGNFSR